MSKSSGSPLFRLIRGVFQLTDALLRFIAWSLGLVVGTVVHGLSALAAPGNTQLAPAQVHTRHIPQNVRHEVFRRDGGACLGCGSEDNLEYDHALPFSMGGASTVDNVQLLCRPCNQKKGATAWRGF